jgi:hypothetical protein
VPRWSARAFLLSDLARGITGEILHVDGGYHAMGAPLVSAGDVSGSEPTAPAVAGQR